MLKTYRIGICSCLIMTVDTPGPVTLPGIENTLKRWSDMRPKYLYFNFQTV